MALMGPDVWEGYGAYGAFSSAVIDLPIFAVHIDGLGLMQGQGAGPRGLGSTYSLC